MLISKSRKQQGKHGYKKQNTETNDDDDDDDDRMNEGAFSDENDVGSEMNESVDFGEDDDDANYDDAASTSASTSNATSIATSSFLGNRGILSGYHKTHQPKAQPAEKKSKQSIIEEIDPKTGEILKSSTHITKGHQGQHDGVEVKEGTRLLHKAVKEQSHRRVLPQHQRHDFEYQLRQIATAGVVRVFNALNEAHTAARRAEAEMQADADETVVTDDRVSERQALASRNAFLNALTKGAAGRGKQLGDDDGWN